MPLYNVEVSTIMVVFAEDEMDAYNVAEHYAREAVSDATPNIHVIGELTSKADVMGDWDVDCRPYGIVRTAIKNILEESK